MAVPPQLRKSRPAKVAERSDARRYAAVSEGLRLAESEALLLLVRALARQAVAELWARAGVPHPTPEPEQ